MTKILLALLLAAPPPAPASGDIRCYSNSQEEWCSLTEAGVETVYIRADGATALTADWDVGGSYDVTAAQFHSDIATSTSPFTVASTTKVANLNCDQLDDQTGSYYLDSANFTGTNWTDLTDSGATTLHTHAAYLEIANIDDVPVDAETAAPISSNWAYDHENAADPHTGYRLESADHTHQSTGAQAGQLDHGLALTGLSDDDHAQYLLAAGSRSLTGSWDAGDEVYVDKLGVATTAVPHGSTGMAKVAIEGTNASSAGPHMQFTTATDDYPLVGIYPWGHDSDISLSFDCYYDGTTWRSSDAGSNFRIRKNADLFQIQGDTGIAAGSAITWDSKLTIDTNGRVGIGVNTIDEHLHVYGASNGDTTVLRLENGDGSLASGADICAIEFENNETNGGVNASIRAVHESTTGHTGLAFDTGVSGSPAEVVRITQDGKVGIGTTTIPHGSTEGGGMLALDGANADQDGPHVQFTTATNDYPLMQMLMFAHDDVYLNFDSYYDFSGGWKSADPTSNFSVAKLSDELRFLWDASVAAGSGITWNTGISLWNDGSVVVGNPTGANNGVGTINAKAVYDDNTLLTCYVPEAAVTGSVDVAKWDGHVRSRYTRNDKDEIIAEEIRNHEPARKFAENLWQLDPQAYADFWRANGYLPAYPSPQEWEDNKKPSLGEMQQKHWETIEVLAVHIDKLNQRITALEQRLPGPPTEPIP